MNDIPLFLEVLLKMIKMRDYSGFKPEDFRFNRLNDGWAKLALRMSWVQVVLFLLIALNYTGLMILTPFGSFFLTITVTAVGFIVALACSRSTLFAGGQKLPYLICATTAVFCTYVGYLFLLFLYLPLFIPIEINVIRLVRASLFVILGLVFHLCFKKRGSLKVFSAMIALLMLMQDFLWGTYSLEKSIIEWFVEELKSLLAII